MIPLQIINHEKIINNADREVAAKTKEVSIMRNKIFVMKAVSNMPPHMGAERF